MRNYLNMGFGELEGFGTQMIGACFWRLKEKEDIWLVPVLWDSGFICGYCLPNMHPLPFLTVVSFFLLPAKGSV